MCVGLVVEWAKREGGLLRFVDWTWIWFGILLRVRFGFSIKRPKDLSCNSAKLEGQIL